MSESFPVGVLLAISGGLMDAYSYLYRGHVFANAQTGNVLMFSIHLSKGEWMSSLHYALPIIAFLSGVADSHSADYNRTFLPYRLFSYQNRE